MLASCHRKHIDVADIQGYDEQTFDSLCFVRDHHYSQNYNFEVIKDSLVLRAELNDSSQVAVIRRGEDLVVADYFRATPDMLAKDSVDSIFIKVAHDQMTIGWVSENDLLEKVVPTDPISQFIHFFTHSKRYYFLVIMAMGIAFFLYRKFTRQRIKIVHFNDIDSFYPTLLCLVIATSATIYGSIQRFLPERWIDYYYHPTLNPFEMSDILFAFLISAWLILICGLALLDDLSHQLGRSELLSYLFTLAGVCVVLYMFFTISVYFYVGYAFYVAYVFFAIHRYWFRNRSRFYCGRCGAKMHKKGVCLHCGAINE